jgi:hypothetical protein
LVDLSRASIDASARFQAKPKSHSRQGLALCQRFCRAVGSPGEEKNSSGQAQDSLSAPLSCPKFTGNLREQQLNAIISCIPEGMERTPNKNAANERYGRRSATQ